MTRKKKTSAPRPIDDYIGRFPAATQRALKQVRAAIRRAAPAAEETISYGMPAFILHGNLVYFAGYKNHVGFYATPSGHSAFEKELARYKTGKGSVQFPLDRAMPVGLIAKMVKFRVKENLEKTRSKKRALAG